MRYVDGYLVPVPKAKLAEYKKVASKAGKIWLEHGALQYCEAVGDDLETPWGVSFNKSAKIKDGEVPVFAFVVYNSRAHRDQVNKKVMKDERLMKMMDPNQPLFEMKRMAFGGFKALVDL
jgi:uncharacterized protein YbaA (DUF1428 family)